MMIACLFETDFMISGKLYRFTPNEPIEIPEDDAKQLLKQSIFYDAERPPVSYRRVEIGKSFVEYIEEEGDE